jgi:DNA-binding protein YbaB
MTDERFALERQLDRARVDLGSLRARMQDVAGVGEAMDGLVRVTCRVGGVIEKVSLDPRAMRRPSADLADAFKAAHAAAVVAAAESAQQALRESGTFTELATQLQDGTVDLVALIERQGIPVRDILRRLSGS